MFVVVFQSGKNKFLCYFVGIAVNEEVCVEGSKIQIAVLGSKSLFEKIMCIICTIEIREHMSLSNFG